MDRWREEIGRLAGDGELSDGAGRTVPVVYVVRTGWESGSKAIGVLARSLDGGYLDLDDSLRLTLQDGRSVAIVPTGVKDPWAPLSFLVPDPGALFRDGEAGKEACGGGT